MARIQIYKNSILATLMSIFGYGVILMGGMLLLDKTYIEGVIMLILGVALKVWADSVSENKRLKVLKKDLEARGLVPEIRASVRTAIEVYNMLPSKKMLAYIRTLNPEAADNIAQQLAAKKK